MESTNTPAIKATADDERELFESAGKKLHGWGERDYERQSMGRNRDEYTFSEQKRAFALWLERAALATPACKTCGGSRVDPGGLPVCRDCATPAIQAVAPDLASLPKYERMARGRQDLRMEEFYAAADVERLLSHSAQASVEPVPFCPACEGSGESTQMSDSGPDAYEIQVPCPHCNGDGGLAAAYRVTLSLLDAEQKANMELSAKLFFAPVEPVSPLTDSRQKIIVTDALEALGESNYYMVEMNLHALLAASPKVEPVIEDKRDAERWRIFVEAIEGACGKSDADHLTKVMDDCRALAHEGKEAMLVVLEKFARQASSTTKEST